MAPPQVAGGDSGDRRVTPVSIEVDDELLVRAKAAGLDPSKVLAEALERILDRTPDREGMERPPP